MGASDVSADRQARLDRFERVLERLFLRLEQDDLDARATAVLKGIAAELTTAGQALDTAAAALKAAGKGYEASQAKQAASRAHQTAQGIVGQ